MDLLIDTAFEIKMYFRPSAILFCQGPSSFKTLASSVVREMEHKHSSFSPRTRRKGSSPSNEGDCAAMRSRRRITRSIPETIKTSEYAPGKDMAADGSRREWQREDLHVVLVHPQIPQNSGNVARTCAATSTALHLVGPLGFELSDKKLKRAGLDYWDWVAVTIHQDIDAFIDFFNGLEGDKALIAYSKFGTKSYAEEGLYKKNTRSFLMFGAETSGLPQLAHDTAVEHGNVVRIPMKNSQHVRSLNLATSVGVGVFEALRQLDGPLL